MPALDCTTADPAAAKAVLRSRMRSVRSSWSAADRAAMSAALCERLEQLLERLAPAVVAVYLARGTEASVDAVASNLLERGVRVAAPAGLGEPPGFRVFKSMDDVALECSWRSPKSGDCPIVPVEELDVVLVPGLAFDIRGSRLGQGGGWYDRVLPRVRCSIGVCFEAQLVPAVPTTAHDAAVQAVITELSSYGVAGQWP